MTSSEERSDRSKDKQKNTYLTREKGRGRQKTTRKDARRGVGERQINERAKSTIRTEGVERRRTRERSDGSGGGGGESRPRGVH